MFVKLKHSLQNLQTRFLNFIELTKTAISIGRSLNSEFLKMDFIDAFVSQTTGSLNMILLGLMINKIAANDRNGAILILVGLTANLLLGSLIQNYISYRSDYLYTFRDLDANKFLLKKIARIPVKYRGTTEFKEIEKNADIRKVFRFFEHFIELASRVYGTVLTIGALTFIQPGILLGVAALGILSAYLDSKSRVKLFESRHELSYYSMLNYSYSANFKVRTIEKLNDNIKINNNLDFMEKIYDKFIHTYKSWYLDYSREVMGRRFYSKNIMDIGTAGSLGFAYMYGINGLIPIGNIIIFGSAYKNLLDSIRFLSTNIALILENYLNVKAVSDLINFPIPTTNYMKIPDTHKLEIEFKNVSFAYPSSDRKVLDNVSFKISHKDKLGIIGENGAGKSTLVKLLFRIYAPTSGTILLNGIDINDISDEDYYQLFSILSQDSIPEEAMTVEDIIYLGDTSKPKSIKRIMEAAKLSTFSKDVKELKDGYKQLLTDKEKVSVYNKYSSKKFTSLSGGQYRKLLLSKVFYGQKPIMVLDEPTDSIDAHSAFSIFKNLNTLKNNQIIIFITHDIQRMQLVADKIMTLKNGKLVEFDTTKNLQKKKDSYFYSALDTYKKTIRE